jgi:cytochrome c
VAQLNVSSLKDRPVLKFKIVGAAQAAALVSALALGGHASAADTMRGKILFLRCASCHDISKTASPKIGPNLYGIVGRKAGALPGFTYSSAMASQHFVWTEANLDRWLTKPSAMVPGTAMGFAGISNEADRQAIIAYLRNPAP